MTLTEQQQKQIDKQKEAHQHENYKIDLKITEDFILKDFEVHKDILRPEVMTSITLARWLYYHKSLYENRPVLDMGSGTGLQGIITGLNGAQRVDFIDSEKNCVKNTKTNAKKYLKNLEYETIQSDLFSNNEIEKIEMPGKGRHEVYIFNHPFFSQKYIGPVNKSMESNRNIGKEFLMQLYFKIDEDDDIIMPFYHRASIENDPETLIEKGNLYGFFEIQTKETVNILSGLQQGKQSIYHIKKISEQ
ncbi:methyltransferase [Candidatus Woesearchaeota archaeon]|nr:methyltransferase [Candidatus Woesearchaeota archaeon]MCF7900905.1 methyltransferase [Candidatus Woesearchaeota archaeon]MCF8013046.1 methyltransferase [Candidatus Woesearchaeota archaeon]